MEDMNNKYYSRVGGIVIMAAEAMDLCKWI